MRKIITIIAAGLCAAAAVAAPSSRQPVILEASEAARLKVGADGLLAGSSMDVLTCVFAAQDRNFEVREVPGRRAQFDVKSNTADGFFPSVHDVAFESTASLSAPIGLEKWYWVAATPTRLFADNFPFGQRIGAVIGSSQMTWLANQGIPIAEQVRAEGQLQALLANRRIDSYVANVTQPATLLPDQNVAMRFAHYAPLGVYFSNQFLERNLGFLDQFNRTLHRCLPDVSPLASNERNKLELLLETVVMPWLNSSEISAALIEANKSHPTLSKDEILVLDRRWRDEVVSGERVMINRMLQNPLSSYLRVIRERQGGVITEIIVMDHKGVNVGISDVTSDYWQGDEEKFLRASVLTSGIYLSDIIFDPSTQKFQVQASLPIKIDGKFSGVVTVGLDIEKALLTD